MYKIVKEKGSNLNVTLLNMGTSATINLGLLSMEILDILEKAGYKFDDKSELKMTDAWALDINEDCAKKLGALAMKISRPARTKDKEVKDLFQKPNKEIDAMDVMLGLANYN